MIPALQAGLGGKSKPIISLAQIAGASLFASKVGGTSNCSLILVNDGNIQRDLNTVITDIGDWITPLSWAGNAYETRVTVNSGVVDTGTTGSWLALGTTRTWTVSRTGIGTDTANVTVEIRNASTLVVLTSATLDISAEVT